MELLSFGLVLKKYRVKRLKGQQGYKLSVQYLETLNRKFKVQFKVNALLLNLEETHRNRTPFIS